MLKTTDLGSLDTGTPIFFRRLQVGQVASYVLDKDGKSLDRQDLRARALRSVRQSEHALLAGERNRRVAFRQRPERADPVAAVDPDRRHRVRDARNCAGAAARPRRTPSSPCSTIGRRPSSRPPRNPQTYQLIFKESVRGLAPGAPVEFRGIPIGEVADIRAQIDVKTFEFSVPVTIHLDPQRLGVKVVDAQPGRGSRDDAQEVDRLPGGARGPCATADREPADRGGVRGVRLFPWRAAGDGGLVAERRCELPTIPGQLEATEAKVDEHHQEARQDAVGADRRRPAQGAGRPRSDAGDARAARWSVRGARSSNTPTILPSRIPCRVQQLDSTLQEVSRAARSVRVLADYLERHPEALLRGKKGEAK